MKETKIKTGGRLFEPTPNISCRGNKVISFRRAMPSLSAVKRYAGNVVIIKSISRYQSSIITYLWIPQPAVISFRTPIHRGS